MKRVISFICALTLLAGTIMFPGCSGKKEKEKEGTEEPVEETLTEKIDKLYAEGIDSAEKAKELRTLVWQEYAEKVAAEEPDRKKEVQRSRITNIKIGRLTMKVQTKVVGRKPEDGYPLFLVFHGGGSGIPDINEQQWSGMADRYVQTNVAGIYVSIRSISDNYPGGQIFATDISWKFYDRIIEDAILFLNANPNKVYVVGYSAGGDGVYHVAPAMADSFASATMSAGHPNGIDLSSLYNVPFYLNVGELDDAYSRNTVTVEYANKLKGLHEQYGGGYEYRCFVHTAKEHGVVGDNAASPQRVIKDIDAWYAAKKSSTEYTGGSQSVTTDAATLMTAHTRDPIPERIVWNVATSRISERKNKMFYWLSVEGQSGTVVASYDRDTNTVTIEDCPKNLLSGLKIYLNEDMLDIFSEVKVVYKDQTMTVTPEISLDLLRETTTSRGDPNFQFCAVIEVDL